MTKDHSHISPVDFSSNLGDLAKRVNSHVKSRYRRFAKWRRMRDVSQWHEQELRLHLRAKKGELSHEKYEQLLCQFDPRLKFAWSGSELKSSSVSKVFHGAGAGTSNTNVYRCIAWNDEYLFEKIMFKKSKEYKIHVKQYAQIVEACAKNGLVVPSVKHVCQGDRLVQVLYHYEERGSELVDFGSLIRAVQKSLNTDLDSRLKIDSPLAPRLTGPGMAKFAQQTRHFFEQANQDVKWFTDSLTSAIARAEWLAHGDITPRNCYVNQQGKCVLIDFDLFGRYPNQYEYVYPCLEFLWEVQSVDELVDQMSLKFNYTFGDHSREFLLSLLFVSLIRENVAKRHFCSDVNRGLLRLLTDG